MDRAASNHFNTVFVNAWSRGYPLWRSRVFSNETGVVVDPGYSSRDILAEAVAEGHRNGLQVFAWFEYGFVGGWTGYAPGASGKGRIFDAHPDWVARQRNGTEMDNNNFYWMAHTRPDAQQFLINLAAEVASNYDLDGIELDRIRYPSLAYGHDPYTLALYASEHGGASPPGNDSNSAWIRWRADKLNEFHANAYDALKALYPGFIVANAPSAYSASAYSAYNSFCQDWVWWLDNHKVDSIELQSYVATAGSFSNILNFVRTQTTNAARIHPSFALRPNNNWIDYAEILKFVDVARAGGFGGQSVWYYTHLNTSNYFSNLAANRYLSPASPPQRPPDWRAHRRLTLVADTAGAVRTGQWFGSANPGFSGPSFYANAGPLAAMDYYAEVPVTGVYEVYVFTVVSGNRATNAPYVVFDAEGGGHTNRVNQTLSANSRWYKLGDHLLAAGRQRVARLSNEDVASGQLVSADALMIVLNRRLSGTPGLAHRGVATPEGCFDLELSGNVGQRIRVEASADARNWTTLATVTLTNAHAAYTDTGATTNAWRFYRAALAP